MDKPLVAKIWPGKKKTYLDFEVKLKEHVPPAKYEILGSMINERRKSNLDKGRRNTLPDEIEAYNKKYNFPSPAAYSPKHKLTLTDDVANLKFKGERGSYLGDSFYKGSISPAYRIPEHKIVEPRVKTHAYKPRIQKSDGLPEFLKSTVASKMISPATYNAM